MADVPVKMPSATAIVVAYLSTHPLITPFAPHVSADLVGYESGQNWIQVTRSGGIRPVRYRIDQPRIDANCYAADKPTAENLAESALAALLGIPPNPIAGGIVTNVDTFQGPADLTDPVNEQPRYTFSVELTLHPHTL